MSETLAPVHVHLMFPSEHHIYQCNRCLVNQTDRHSARANIYEHGSECVCMYPQWASKWGVQLFWGFSCFQVEFPPGRARLVG